MNDDLPSATPSAGAVQLPKIDASRLTFFMVGCPRCGTTWTRAALREHPQVFVAGDRQLHYFDEQYANGPDWYLGHYAGVGAQHRAVGEVATDYSLPHAIARLAADFPHVKLVMGVRHPIERAYSFYESRAPHATWPSFAAALDDEPELLQRGRYIEEIEDIYRFFPRERLLIEFFDDLKADEVTYIRTLFQYLDVDDTFRPGVIGNPLRAAMFPELRRQLKRMGLTPAVNLVNRSWMGDVIRRRLRRSSLPRKSPIEPALRRKLVDYYRPLNARLAKLTGRDLAHWDH